MLQYLRLLNPLLPISTEADARAAARAGAVGIFLTVGWSLVTLIVFDLMGLMRAAMSEGMKSGYRADPAAEKMVEAMMPLMTNFMLGTMVVFLIGYVILGIVQWKKQTSVIPLLLLLWTGCSVLMAVVALLPNPALPAQARVTVPIVQEVAGHAVTVATILLYIVGFKGGTFLQKLRSPAPATAGGD